MFIHIFQLSLLYHDVSVENTHFLFQYCWGSYIPWRGGGSLTIKWTVDLTISGNTMGDHTFNLGKGGGLTIAWNTMGDLTFYGVSWGS